VEMVSKGQYFLACCKNEGDLKGVLIIFEVGQKLHYIIGGTLREEVDLKVGHFLHDQVIQIGIEKGYDFYDISMGGSDGVVRFKEGFGGEIIEITEPRYWVLKPLQFAAFQKLLPWVQKNKSKIANLLSKLK
jgi:lipid II:glycine glycyltransferase (peptidoglycan interpeptide bridge formation enzyme)